jgi:uracil-DNA glycosylase
MAQRPPKSGKPEGNPFVPHTTNFTKLRQAAKECKNCDLWERGTQTVFGEGEPDSKVMFIGEQPGNDEDLQGRPFIGPAGCWTNCLSRRAWTAARFTSRTR